MLIKVNLFDVDGEALIETANMNSAVKDNDAGCLLVTFNNNKGNLRIRATFESILALVSKKPEA